MTTIGRAYCRDLDLVVTASEARRLYLADERVERWSFLCEHEECRRDEVRVTCVNYWRSATEEETYVPPHYRQLDEHVSADAHIRKFRAKTSPGRHQGLAVLEQEAVAPKLTTWCMCLTRARTAAGALVLHRLRCRPAACPGPVHILGLAELDATTGTQAFQAVEVRVKHRGTIRLINIFKHVKHARVGTPELVLHGGCSLVRRFGLGFKLQFIDKLDGYPVVLYVDKTQVAAYRFKKSLLDVVDMSSEYSYLSAYAWATLRWAEDRKQFEVEVQSLKHLALYPGRRVVPAKLSGEPSAADNASST